MEHAHARPRGDEEAGRVAPPALRAVPDDLSPAERRDWIHLAERRERAERRRRQARGGAVSTAEPAPPRARATAAPSGERPASTSRERRPPGRPADDRQLRPDGGPARRRSDAVEVPATPPEPRRTVRITGAASAARPRTGISPLRSIGANPDRLALWAVVLCLFMALVAAATARGEDRGGAAERGPDPAPAAQIRR